MSDELRTQRRAEPLTLDLRAIVESAADALHDAGTVGGAQRMYLRVEYELRTLIAVLDEAAAREP